MSNFPFEAHEDVSNNRSGIYAIVNIANGKLYIGSAVKLNRRKSQHLNKLNLDTHRNRHLQSSFNKYGKDYFVFKVVEYCEIKDLIAREQIWINQFDFDIQLYNLNPIAGSFLGFKHTEESRTKMSQVHKGKIFSKETRNKLSQSCKKRIISDETRNKMSEAAKNRSEEHRKKLSERGKVRVFSEEIREKLSFSHQKSILMLDKETGEVLRQFNSLKEAGTHLGVKKTTSISSVLRGKRKQAYGYTWRYVN